MICILYTGSKVLGCRYVDDVLLDAPWRVSQEMIATLGISVVVRGTVCDTCRDADDPHAVPSLFEGLLKAFSRQFAGGSDVF